MRRLMASVLMISLLLGLNGCGSGREAERKIDALRTSLEQAEELSFTAEVKTDLGEEEFSCILLCSVSEDETVMQVLEPELVAGVTAHFFADGAGLEFDGVELSLGMTGDGYSPMTAVPNIIDALLRGHVTQTWIESGDAEKLTAAEVYLDESRGVLLWFEEESMTPIYAELVIGDTVVVQCSIRDFKVD